MDSPWTLERTARVLGICCLLALGLLLVWFFVFVIAGDLAFGVHSALFDIDRNQFDLVMYYGMAFLKLVVIIFFLIPYISLKLVLRGE